MVPTSPPGGLSSSPTTTLKNSHYADFQPHSSWLWTRFCCLFYLLPWSVYNLRKGALSSHLYVLWPEEQTWGQPKTICRKSGHFPSWLDTLAQLSGDTPWELLAEDIQVTSDCGFCVLWLHVLRTHSLRVCGHSGLTPSPSLSLQRLWPACFGPVRPVL
jgi:hypothetical protein